MLHSDKVCRNYEHENKDARSFSSETQEEIRRKAVPSCVGGKKHVEAAESLGSRAHRRQME